MKQAHAPGLAHLIAFGLALAFGYSCGNPVPLEERSCPCLNEDGYVCCQATGKCIRAGATCSAGADAAADGAGGSGGTDGAVASDVPADTGGGGSGGSDARRTADSATANELTVDRWTPISKENAPSSRANAAAVWTGKELIIWGGSGGMSSVPLATGGRYDATADRWTTLATLRAPSARYSHTAVWTGSEMIVWGGLDSNGIMVDSGGRYNPATDTWTPITRTGAPAGRLDHVAVWGGSRMVIWGGRGPDLASNLDGGRYDPATDSWSPISKQDAPAPAFASRSIWTGTEVLLFGGVVFGGSSYDRVANVGLYNPTTDGWRRLPSEGAPPPRDSSAVLWTGREAIVWGGAIDFPGGGSLDAGLPPGATPSAGAVLDPQAGTWRPVGTSDQPRVMANPGAVFADGAGSRGTGFMLVHGAPFQGGAYDLASDQWWPISMEGAPVGEIVFWTGRHMLVWDQSGAQGARYEP